MRDLIQIRSNNGELSREVGNVKREIWEIWRLEFLNINPKIFLYNYTLGDDITAMMALGSNRSVAVPLDSDRTVTHIPMGASSVSGGYLSTAHADQTYDLTAEHTDQEQF